MRWRIQILLLLLLFSLPFGKILLAQNQQTCVIQGTVRDQSSQQPVPNVTVNLYTNNNQNVMTDQNGFFRFANAQRMFCSIQATGPDIYCLPINIDPTNQDTVTINLQTKPGGKLTGKVTDEQNQPIANANVDYFQDNMGSRLQKTDTQGAFSFSGLNLDSPISEVNVFLTGFQYATQQDIEFPPGQKEINLTFQLSSAAVDTTKGFVKVTITGDVMDSSSNPISGATVANATYNLGISMDNRFVLNNASQNTITDNNGLFILKNVTYSKDSNNPFQSYQNLMFYASATGYAPAWKQMASEQDTVLHFILSDAHYVAGKVVDSDGNPLTQVNCSYQIQPKFARQGTIMGYELYQGFSTDSDGLFHVDSLPNEGINFSFSKPNYIPVHDTALPLDKEDNVITLVPSGQVMGMVIDDMTGKPIPSFQVSVAPTKESQQETRYDNKNPIFIAFTPEDGKFTLSNLAFFIRDPKGNIGSHVLVSVQAEGYQQEDVDMIPVQTPPLNEKNRVMFRMKKAFPVSGIVVENHTGKPVPDVKVTARISKNENLGYYDGYFWDKKVHYGGEEQESFFKTTTDAHGRFQFNSLPSKTGGIALEKQGYGRSFFSQIDYTNFIQLKLPRPGSITALFGEKANLSSDSITGSLDKNDPSGRAEFEFERPNQEGKIVYSDLPPGNYDLQVTRKGSHVTKKITLLEGQNLVLDLSTTNYIKISGHVWWKGAPAINASIGCYSPDTLLGESNTISDQNGKYQLLLSMPGKYYISFGEWLPDQSKYMQIRKTLSVSSGEYQLDCNLPDSAIIGLLMNPKEGKPVPQTIVTAYQKKMGDEARIRNSLHTDYMDSVWVPYKSVTTDDNGQFAFENLESGDMLVAEEKQPGIASAEKVFKLNVNETKNNAVFMQPESGSLEIRLQDADTERFLIPSELGCADSTGFVYTPALVKEASLFSPNELVTDSTGRVLYSSLPAGSYTLYARTEEYPTASTTFQIFSGKKTAITLKLKKGGRLAFPLKEKKELSGQKFVYCLVKITQAKNEHPAMQDARGTYKKTAFGFNTLSRDTAYIPLPEGEYVVEVQTNYRASSKPVSNTQTKLLKVEQGKDALWEISIANFLK